MRLRAWHMAAGAAIILAAAWLAVLAPDLRARRVHAELPNPRFVREGSSVYYSGMEVGRVMRIECSDSSALLTMDVHDRSVSLSTSHQVRRTRLGLIGDDAVEIVAPRERGEHPLTSADTLRGMLPAPVSAKDSAARNSFDRAVKNTTPAPCRHLNDI